MKSNILYGVIFLFQFCTIYIYPQIVIPDSYCSYKKYLDNISIIKLTRVRSKITWVQDSQEGYFLLTNKKIQQENYNINGLLEEIVYFGSDEKTDSIDIFTYENNLPVKKQTFNPVSNILKTVKYKFNDKKLISEIYNYRNSEKPTQVYKYLYSTDSVQIFELLNGTSIISKKLIVIKGSENCKNKKILISVYDNDDNPILRKEILRIDTKEVENFLYPDQFKKINILNDQSNPLEIKKINSNNQVIATTIYKYLNNGLPTGIAEYSGDVNKESGNENYDIISDNKQPERSGIIKIIKYSYQYY